MESYGLGLFLSLWCGAFIFTRIGLMRLFKLAGQPAFMAWIPVLSWWYWIKLVGRPSWYMIGMLIPGLNILFSFNITLDLLRSFGKNKFWEQLVGTVFSFILFPTFIFDNKLKFLGAAGSKEWRKNNVKNTSYTREWADAILFAAYVAGGMRALYFDLYQIPTPSMESNLMVGDYLVVSRAKVGMRIPMTPITVPIVAPKEIMGMKAYSDLVELPYMRLPGWYTIVGKIQKRFLALMKEYVTEDFLLENNLGDFTFPNPKIAQTYVEAGRREGRMVIPYHFYTYQENFEKLKKHPSVLSIFEDVIDDGTGRPRFPDTNNTVFLKHKWDMNNYGPIYLPKRNETIALTKDNWDFLKLAINKYENNNIVCLNGKFYEDGGNGKEITSYTFKMGYYWMIGDNRYNSLDSRYWGYVPEDHIIGKPLFTFFSLKMVMNIDEETNEPFIGHGGPEYVSKGIRWNKILKMID